MTGTSPTGLNTTGTGMTPVPLTDDRARLLLEAYGADPARWPSDERAVLHRWTQDSAAGRAALAEARALDALLDQAFATDPVTPTGEAALKDRILADAARFAGAHRPKAGGVVSGLGSVMRHLEDTVRLLVPVPAGWHPAAVLGCSMAVGLTLGLIVPGASGPDPAETAMEELVMLAFDPGMMMGTPVEDGRGHDAGGRL